MLTIFTRVKTYSYRYMFLFLFLFFLQNFTIKYKRITKCKFLDYSCPPVWFLFSHISLSTVSLEHSIFTKYYIPRSIFHLKIFFTVKKTPKRKGKKKKKKKEKKRKENVKAFRNYSSTFTSRRIRGASTRLRSVRSLEAINVNPSKISDTFLSCFH